LLLSLGCFITPFASLVSNTEAPHRILLTANSYNAAIFKIITVSEYKVVLLENESSSVDTIIPFGVERLDNSQWASVHRSGNITRYGDLYLIVDEGSYTPWQKLKNINFDFADYFPMNLTGSVPAESGSVHGWSDFSWLADKSKIPENITTVRPYRLHVKEAYATNGEHQSRIQISLPFMLVVVFFNFFKLVVMLGILMRDQSEYIVTLGDTASSYLENPEDLTKGRSTLEMDQMIRSFGAGLADASEARVWQPRRRRYYSSIGYDKALSATIA